MKKGLLIFVYRDTLGDCTNGGITGRFDQLTLVGDGIPEIFEVTDDRPAVKLVERNFGGRVYKHLEPVEPVPENQTPYCAGGNFAYTSDTRFPSDYPLSVHDRSDTWEAFWEAYEILSR